MISSGTATLDLQTAEYARLTGNTALMALVTGVFDAVPQAQARPYITIGESTEIPNRAFANDGRELTRTFHIYDQDGVSFAGIAARGNSRALGILNALILALESSPLTVQGFAVVDYAYEFGQPMPGEDDGKGGMYRHVVARFRATLEAA